MDRILESGVGVLSEAYQMTYFPGDDLFAIKRPRGLPIGNLTSQFWANVSLNQLDQFVKRELQYHGHSPAYLRFVDDFLLFADHKAALWAWKKAIIAKLAAIRLTIHENQAQVFPTRTGIPFLGFRVFPTHRRVKRRKVIHFHRKLKHKLALFERKHLPYEKLVASIQGWINHVRYADTWGLRCSVLRFPIPRDGASQI
jgi:hypothetical protein